MINLENKIKLENFILLEINYNKDNRLVTLINKFDISDIGKDLDNLKICHNSKFIYLDKTKVQEETIKILFSHIGYNFEPINVHVVYGTKEEYIIVYSNLEIPDFKIYLSRHFNIPQVTNISLTFKNNSKNIILDKIGYDKKNECWLNLKQLKIVDKSLIFISKSNEDGISEGKLIQDKEEKINIIAKIEDEEEFTLVKAELNMSFKELTEKIKRKLKLISMEVENVGEKEILSGDDLFLKNKINDDIQIRLRKELDGKLIYKNLMNNLLNQDEMFIDGGVRLRIEFGEPYEANEILLKILLDINGKKETKDFIGDPEKISILNLKKFICDTFSLKPEEFMFYKTSALGDPNKAIKNENQSIFKTGLKDSDTIFLKNISSELNEIFSIKIYQNNLDPNDHVFKPLCEESFLFEMNIPKETTLKVIKENLISRLNLNCGSECLRLRILGKKYDMERILRGNENTIKKLNLENPCSLVIEVLEEVESLKENQIQLYFWRRNINDKTYFDKKSVIFEIENNVATSDKLYNKCRKETLLANIKITKYLKSNYLWEQIPEFENNLPINLRKNFNLKDGDWIGIRNEEDNYDLKDDFQTLEDKRTINLIRNNKVLQSSASLKRANRFVEKPLRIPKFN